MRQFGDVEGLAIVLELSADHHLSSHVDTTVAERPQSIHVSIWCISSSSKRRVAGGTRAVHALIRQALKLTIIVAHLGCPNHSPSTVSCLFPFVRRAIVSRVVVAEIGVEGVSRQDMQLPVSRLATLTRLVTAARAINIAAERLRDFVEGRS